MSDNRTAGFVATTSQRHSETVEIERFDQSQRESRSDLVSVEEPLEIRLAGEKVDERTLAITMRTPGNDHELALGFLFGEGIVSSMDDVNKIEHCRPPSPDKGYHNTICVRLADGVSFQPAQLERHFYTSSSCGVCGKTSIESVMAISQATVTDQFKLSAENLGALPAKLREQQKDFEQTGGIHAAGLIDEAGDLVLVREDVGRHNALDKLIGSCLMQGVVPLTGHGVLLSGRASFELIQKAAIAGIELIASIGPPSSLAVELADRVNMTVAGFVSQQSFNSYAHGHRIIGR